MDNSLFVRHHANSVSILLIYVDVILITSNDSGLIQRLLLSLSLNFDMRQLGPLKHFLGIDFLRTKSGMILSQSQYATQLLQQAGMESCNSCPTPMIVQKGSNFADDSPFTNRKLYRSFVGTLQYLTTTRPDLSFAVNVACQHMHQPTQAHFQALKRLLRYVKGTLNYALYYTPGSLIL